MDAEATLGADDAGEEDAEDDRQGHRRGQCRRRARRRADHQEHAAGQRHDQMGDELVAMAAAEPDHHQGGESAEGREGGHLKIAQHLAGEGEQRRDDQRRAQGAQAGRPRPDGPELSSRLSYSTAVRLPQRDRSGASGSGHRGSVRAVPRRAGRWRRGRRTGSCDGGSGQRPVWRRGPERQTRSARGAAPAHRAACSGGPALTGASLRESTSSSKAATTRWRRSRRWGCVGLPTNHVAPNGVVIRVHRGHANQSCLKRRFEGQPRVGWR